MTSPPALHLDTPDGRWVLAATVMASAVAMLTGTVVNVALPAIGHGLEAGTVDMQWVLNGYLLALASLILIGGTLGDRFGRRRLMIIGGVAFAVASLMCAVAPAVEMLIVARVIQGGSAALLMPQSLAIIEATFREADRGRAIGAWSALGGIAAAVGPLVGGWLVDQGSWRWVFLLNLPIVAVVIAVSAWKVPETRDPDAKRLDRAGALTAFLGLGGITWALIHGPDWGWAEPAVWGTGILGVVVLAAFFAIERRTRHAMVPLDMFANGQFSAANAVTFVIYATIGGVFFFLVVYLQTGMGFSALMAGASLLPVTFLMLSLSSKAGDIAQRHGARLPLTVGGVLIAAGLLLFARIERGDAYVWSVLPGIVVFGLGLSATVAPVTTAVLAAADERRAGAASGINNAVARTAQLLAVALIPWVAGLSGEQINQPAALAAGFPRAMIVLGATALLGAAVAWKTIASGPIRRRRVEEAPGRCYRHCSVDAPPQRVRPAAPGRETA